MRQIIRKKTVLCGNGAYISDVFGPDRAEKHSKYCDACSVETVVIEVDDSGH